MTKKELEKEAEEYARDTYEMCSYQGLPYASDRRARQQAFLAGAEPREKRIAELEAQIEKMKNALNKIIKTVQNDNISGYGDRLVIIYDVSCEVLQEIKEK